MTQIIVKTIGSGQDYPNPQSWWDNITAGGSGDLITRNVVEIGQLAPGSHYFGNVILNADSGLANTDPYHYFILRCHPTGEWVGKSNMLPTILNVVPTGNAVAINSNVPYMRYEHIVISQTGVAIELPSDKRFIGFQNYHGLLDSCGVVNLTKSGSSDSGILSLVGIKVNEGCEVRNSVVTGLTTIIASGDYYERSLAETIGILQADSGCRVYNNTIFNINSYNYTSGSVYGAKGIGYQFAFDIAENAFLPPPKIWIDSYSSVKLWSVDKSRVDTWYDRSGNGNDAKKNNFILVPPHWRGSYIDLTSEPINQHAGLIINDFGDLPSGYTIFSLVKGTFWNSGVARVAYGSSIGTHQTYVCERDPFNGHWRQRIGIDNVSYEIPYGYTDVGYDKGLLTVVCDPYNDITTYYNGGLGSGLTFTAEMTNDYVSGVALDTDSTKTTFGGYLHKSTGLRVGSSMSGMIYAFLLYDVPLGNLQRQIVETSIINQFGGIQNLYYPNWPLVFHSDVKNNVSSYRTVHATSGNSDSKAFDFGGSLGTYNASDDITSINDSYYYSTNNIISTAITGINNTDTFLNISPFDTHIKSPSALKGSGTALSHFMWDIEGQIRQNSWDIGADQAGSGANSLMPDGISLVLPTPTLASNLTLFTSGFYGSNSGLTLYLENRIAENSLPLLTSGISGSGTLFNGNMNLFVKAMPVPSDIVPLFISGSTTVSDSNNPTGTLALSSPLFIQGGVSTTIPLFLQGSPSDNVTSNMNLFLKGPNDIIQGISVANIPFYVGSPMSSSANSGMENHIQLIIKGILGRDSGGLPCYIGGCGPIGVNSGIALYVGNNAATSGMTLIINPYLSATTTLYTAGHDWTGYSGNITLAISGGVQKTGTLNLVIKNGQELSKATTLFVSNTGVGSGTPLYVRGGSFGADPFSSGTPGALQSYTNMNLFINRQTESLVGTTSLFLKSIMGTSSGTIPLIMSAISGIIDNSTTLTTEGHGGFTNTIDLFTHGF